MDSFEVHGRAVIVIGDLCFAPSDTCEQREEVRGYLLDAVYIISMHNCIV